MHARLARSSDGEAIRSIYNAEVVGSTATFDLVPRTAVEQTAWLEEHRGPYPAVVAVDDEDQVRRSLNPSSTGSRHRAPFLRAVA